jgi:replicative DNA helicase
MKPLPHRPEAERALLGGLMLHLDPLAALAEVAELLRPEDLYQPRAAAIYRAMHVLAERGAPIDVITLEAQLRRTGDLDLVGGIEGLAMLDRHATAHNLKAHAELIAESARRRRLLLFGRELAEELAEEVEDLDEVVDRRAAEFAALAQTGRVEREPWHVSTVLDATFKEMIDEASGRGRGVSTGYPILDRMCKRTGPRPGWLVVLGGRPKMGKTTAALGLTRAAQFVRQDGTYAPHPRPAHVLWACDEMKAGELVQRSLADLTGLDGRSVGVPTESWLRRHMGDLTRARQLLDAAPLHFVPDRDTHYLDRIFAYARSWRARHPIVGRDHDGRPIRELAVIVLDYLQRFAELPGTSKHASQTERVGKQVKLCKTEAQDLDVVVILLSQLNRDADKRPDHRPVRSDFRDSGEIEQEADVLIGCYRPIEYAEDAGVVRGQVAELTRRSGLAAPALDLVLSHHDVEQVAGDVVLARSRCLLGRGELESLVEAKRKLTATELIVIANRHGPPGTVHADLFGEYFRMLPTPTRSQ